jgi:hypothetical protein
MSNKSTFWIGGGVGITFQLRTMPLAKVTRAGRASLRDMNETIQRDLYDVFRNEGAIDNYSKWAPLSPLYRKSKEKALKRMKKTTNKILQLGGYLMQACISGHLNLVTTGKRLVLGFKLGDYAQRVAPYAVFQALGSNSVGRASKKEDKRSLFSKGKRKYTAEPSKAVGMKRVPGRHYIRLKKETVEMLNNIIGRLWSEQNVETHSVWMGR